MIASRSQDSVKLYHVPGFDAESHPWHMSGWLVRHRVEEIHASEIISDAEVELFRSFTITELNNSLHR